MWFRAFKEHKIDAKYLTWWNLDPKGVKVRQKGEERRVEERQCMNTCAKK